MDPIVLSLWAGALVVLVIINILQLERNTRVMRRLENAVLASDVAEELEANAKALRQPSLGKTHAEVVSPKPPELHSPSSEKTLVEAHSPRPIASANGWVKLPYCGADADEPIAEKGIPEGDVLTSITPAPAGVWPKPPKPASDEPTITFAELLSVQEEVDDSTVVNLFDAMALVEASRHAGVCGEEEEVPDSDERKTREFRRTGHSLEILHHLDEIGQEQTAAS